MKKIAPHRFVAVAALGLALQFQTAASGSYAPRVPRGSPHATAAGETKAGRAQYALGQKVYLGKARLPKTADAAAATAQSPRLSALQAALPAAEARAHDLTALAGRLTADQLDGLENFVHKRFANVPK